MKKCRYLRFCVSVGVAQGNGSIGRGLPIRVGVFEKQKYISHGARRQMVLLEFGIFPNLQVFLKLFDTTR